jgi:hypothetical protein
VSKTLIFCSIYLELIVSSLNVICVRSQFSSKVSTLTHSNPSAVEQSGPIPLPLFEWCQRLLAGPAFKQGQSRLRDWAHRWVANRAVDWPSGLAIRLMVALWQSNGGWDQFIPAINRPWLYIYFHKKSKDRTRYKVRKLFNLAFCIQCASLWAMSHRLQPYVGGACRSVVRLGTYMFTLFYSSTCLNLFEIILLFIFAG